VKLARGADVLVHSVMYPPAVPRLVARVPNAAVLEKSVLAHQTSAEDAGRIAQEAGVKTLVLSHFVPPDDPEVTEAMWLEARRNVISGERSSSAEISLRSNLAADDQNAACIEPAPRAARVGRAHAVSLSVSFARRA
jgi:ribonuclease BN (tRNA processing enzyme)